MNGECFREAEVQHDDVAIGRHHGVGGLQVPVNDRFLVSGVERLGDLQRGRERLFQRKGTGPQLVRERLALDELEDEIVHAVDLFESVNGGDVGMVESGEKLRLALEPAAALIGSERLGKHFDGNVPAELRIGGPIDNPHASGPELLGDAVVLERLADHAVHYWQIGK